MNEDVASELANNLNLTLDRIADSLVDPDSGNAASVSQAVEEGLKRVADAITPCVAGGTDEVGGHVESLTEAVMGTTTALCRIADALNNIAEAIRERSS